MSPHADALLPLHPARQPRFSPLLRSILLLGLPFLALLSTPVESQTPPFFRDISGPCGLHAPHARLLKYGGPTIADLDDDGYPDLLLSHHDSAPLELYFNARRPRAIRFLRSPFHALTDMHGVVVAPRTPRRRSKIFTVSSGGNWGIDPVPPLVFTVDPGRNVKEVTESVGIEKWAGGRGRTAVFMDLKGGNDQRFPDVLFTNAEPLDKRQPHHFAYENIGGQYKQRTLHGLRFTLNTFAAPVDYDMDGRMDLVTYHNLAVYRLTAPFTFTDVSARVLPPDLPRKGVVAVAELDFDNDGDFDLYIARTNSGDLRWLPNQAYPDLLLENVGGRYVDVSRRAGLLPNSASRGVTAADFNNDGWIDLFVPQFQDRDLMLLNRGDGTFHTVRRLVSRPSYSRGDHATAVDLDLDGRVDLVVSQGHQLIMWHGGAYKILHNELRYGTDRGFLTVRVGSAPDFSATSLHAVVTVWVGKRVMKRRVGSPGDAVSRSFLETVHFGLGRSGSAREVTVKWTSGKTQTREDVKAGSRIKMGQFPKKW